ncbi:amino acid permease [Haloarcula sp. CBA1131]|uniref:APC family permease n=1 Tax=Haloarcula sp. CBA1131 TaxID=1853686 RepID=UPI001246FC02|nr:amino acid permease [Haloarcula sp. CBA1131]KAA9406532.1 amino acid permease [Haloarcula sp. CBA1131]
MAKDLERDLGLLSVVAISIGAMVGSGIFILPALAVKDAGAGIIAAYLLAGVLVLPAALSKAEMATAMPEAGGTYVYIERSMGPLLGTVSGLGTWFSLSFKGALALVGGVPYLVLLFDLPIRPVAITLAVVLVLVNILGAEQTGRLQIGIVAVMLVAIGWFVAGGGPAVNTATYGGMWEYGASGIFAATGLVFVSFAGVTKIASVAEEVEDPDRVIPLGMLGSLGFTTLLYVLVVAVVVGVIPLDQLAGSTTPIADAAEATLGTAGVAAVVLAAILALVSTANAGILSSSRYPFAMSRDGLAPDLFSTVSDRFGTPVTAISLTGGVMLLLILFVPILEIAKLASAFKILVFALINVALIGFRESDAPDYDPSFEVPLYPWTPIFGTITGFALLTQMGLIAIVGAVGIVVGSVVWYLGYVRPRVTREGAIKESVRRSIGDRALDRTEETLDETAETAVLVALPEGSSRRSEATLLEVGAALTPNGSSLSIVQFDEVPDQQPLDYASGVQSHDDLEFECRTDTLAAEFDVPVEYGELVSHHPERAVANAVDERGVDVLLVERGASFEDSLLGDSIDRIRKQADCDTIAVDAQPLDALETITLVTTRGPYDPLKVRVGNAVATETGADLQFLYPLDERQSAEERQQLEAYHDDLLDLCDVPTERTFVDRQEFSAAIDAADSDRTLLIHANNGGLAARTSNDDGSTQSAIQDSDHASMEVDTKRHPDGVVGRLLERLAF